MARRVEPKLTELYGEYPKLTDLQRKYVEFITNPEIQLRAFKEAEIAEIIGVDKRTLYSYRQDIEVREAITQEQLLKAADDLPDQIKDLRDMSLGRGSHKDIGTGYQIKAKEVWFKIFGFIDDVKNKNVEAKKALGSSFEKRLMNIDKQYRPDTLENKE